MRGLFLLPRLPWPTHDGQAVIAHHLLRCLADRGHHLHVALLEPPAHADLLSWPLAHRISTEVVAPQDDATALTAAQTRWLNYWGLLPELPEAIAALVDRHQPDFIEAFGINVLPLLGNVRRACPTIWLAADDRCLHQLSQLPAQRTFRGALTTLRHAATMAMYERAFRHTVDAAVAVSPRDARALRFIGGFEETRVITNGVELPLMPPVEPRVQPNSVMFWGNLDFAPNIEAIRWFARHVWPDLAARHNNAIWWIAGSGRGEAVRLLTAHLPGVKLLGCVEDLTSFARRAAAVVIPMRSGTGVKNKLLEAAAMARPIVASPAAVTGLDTTTGLPCVLARKPAQWIGAVEEIWAKPLDAALLGRLARNWVADHHDWRKVAEQHESLITSLLKRRPAAARTSRRAAA